MVHRATRSGKLKSNKNIYNILLECLFDFQDMAADKASLSSVRSFRSSDLDSTSITSMHKRIAQRTKLQHRAMSLDSNSGSNNIPESLETEEVAPATVKFSTQEVKEPLSGKITPASSMGSVKSSGKSPQPTKKGLSKSNILRSIFFSSSSNSSKS